jgi:hypothetical protein
LAAGYYVDAISAFYHDHLFVPDHRANAALTLLQSRAREQADPFSTEPGYASISEG